MKSGILFIMLIAVIHLCMAADDSVPEGGRRHSLGIDVRPSYTFSSYRDDILSSILDASEARNIRFGTSIHLQYGFYFPRGSRQESICPEAWQGVGASVTFFGDPKGTGTPLSVYAFQGAPVLHFSRRLSAYYEWNFGASFGWHPCDLEQARTNLIVGSRVNAYINLGAGLMYRLNDRFSLMAGINLTHYSNGNTSFPNPGVNLAGLRIGIIYGKQAFKPAAPYVEEAPRQSKSHLEFDLTVYGSLRKRVYRGGETPVLLNGRYVVAGLDFAPMWRITKNFRTGPSLDLQWDESTDLRRHYAYGSTSDDIRFYRPPFIRQVCVGLSARAELVMPLFSVNVGIGYNPIGPEETRASYQLACLKVRLTDAFFINIGYQLLDFQKQNNLMLGLGYTFH